MRFQSQGKRSRRGSSPRRGRRGRRFSAPVSDRHLHPGVERRPRAQKRVFDAVALQLPIGAEGSFVGEIDLLTMKAEIYKDDLGKVIEETEIPADMLEKAKEYRQKIVEAVAESDEELLMKFLDGEELTLDEIKTAAVVKALKALNADKGALIVTEEKNEKVILSARNIPDVKTSLVNTINVFDILKYDSFLVTKAAVEKIQEVYV